MSVLDRMPTRDGLAMGNIIIGDDTNPPTGPSLTWGTQYPAVSVPQGMITVRAFQKGLDTYIVREASEIEGSNFAKKHDLYWLPWGNGHAASASWANLATSQLFLTSTFSGCRFVVNVTGVAHVAWSGHADPVTGVGTPTHRDAAEIVAGSGNPAAGNIRRTLSVTGNVAGRAATERRITYNWLTQRCVVIGWKVGSIWTFKCLIMSLNSKLDDTNPDSSDAPTLKPKWHTLATVDLAGGVVQVR